MLSQVKSAVIGVLLLTLITGIAYPMLVTGVSHFLFHNQSHGSLIRSGDKGVVGSSLIGQAFSDPKYFWSRPSATMPAYNAAASSGSNLGPLNPELTNVVRERVGALRKLDPENRAPVPIDLVTTSASGLDPHISPAAAYYQIGRVARTRGLDAGVIGKLIDKNIEKRQFRILGEPRVNVLQLNLALDDVWKRLEKKAIVL